MEFEPTPAPAANDRVPEELMQQLGQATTEFHDCREHLEEEFDSYEPDLEQRLEPKRHEFEAAEQRLEEVTQKINEKIEKKASIAQDTRQASS